MLRGIDTVARYAGDEFDIICGDFTDSATDIAAEVAAIANRINIALSEPAVMFQGSDLLVTASIGAALTNSSTTVEDLLADADNAMYVAKQRGPGQFVLHDRSIGPAVVPCQSWHDQSALPRLEVFVNVSPRQLANPKLDRVVAAALDRHGIAPEELGLKIVERFMTEPLLIGRAEAYRERGHPLATDDLGTGFSSLSRLVDLPVGHAKIDHSVTARITVDERRLRLVESIVVVAHRLGMQVTAEGVETSEQADLLTEAGCDRLQDYLFGRPRTGAQLAAGWASTP